jgi:hypothetical protein
MTLARAPILTAYSSNESTHRSFNSHALTSPSSPLECSVFNNLMLAPSPLHIPYSPSSSALCPAPIQPIIPQTLPPIILTQW